MSEGSPGNGLNFIVGRYPKEARILVERPNVSSRILGYGKEISDRNALNGTDPALLQPVQTTKRPEPNLTLLVLKERIRGAQVFLSALTSIAF